MNIDPSISIKVYLVGGAVRDRVLGRPVKDLDFVVVGATPDDMLELGFQQVGADFPVFLHPQGNHEFALARTERKSGTGYQGFDVDFNKEITLEEDLIRRDLTMNSMAVEVGTSFLTDPNQKIEYSSDDIIDPYNGLLDLKQRVICHTSEAFSDDPLRVLRAARFAARYNFKIDHRTRLLMEKIAKSGEMETLPVERVYVEFKKALMEDYPKRFFDEMPMAAYELFFDAIGDFHNSGLDFAITLNASFEDRIMLLCMALNPDEVHGMLTRLKAPSAITEQVTMSCYLERMVWHVIDEHDLEYTGLWEMFRISNAWKKIPLIQNAANIQLYWGCENTFKAVKRIMLALHIGSSVNFNSLSIEQQADLKGKEISDAISRLRHDLVMEKVLS